MFIFPEANRKDFDELAENVKEVLDGNKGWRSSSTHQESIDMATWSFVVLTASAQLHGHYHYSLWYLCGTHCFC
ncbi:unnamed protein product [Arabidopsis lyrata]|nr:unnamed protein product [Arabidopsis lyrata]